MCVLIWMEYTDMSWWCNRLVVFPSPLNDEWGKHICYNMLWPSGLNIKISCRFAQYHQRIPEISLWASPHYFSVTIYYMTNDGHIVIQVFCKSACIFIYLYIFHICLFVDWLMSQNMFNLIYGLMEKYCKWWGTDYPQSQQWKKDPGLRKTIPVFLSNCQSQALLWKY